MMAGWSANDNMRVIAAVEMIAPNLPATCFLSAAEARKVSILGALGGLLHYGLESTFSRGLTPDMPAHATGAVNFR